MVIFPEVMRRLAREAPPIAFPVLIELHARLQPERWGLISQREIGDDIGLSKASVSAAMSALTKVGLLEKRGAGARVEWRLAADAGWKGTAASYQKTVRERAAETSGGKVTPLSAHRRRPLVAADAGDEMVGRVDLEDLTGESGEGGEHDA